MLDSVLVHLVWPVMMPSQMRSMVMVHSKNNGGTNNNMGAISLLGRRMLATVPELAPVSSETSFLEPAHRTQKPSSTDRELRPFRDIPGPLALPFLGHAAYVMPRIGLFHHVVGTESLERLQARYGDLVRLGKSVRKRPALFVFNPELMIQVYSRNCTEPPKFQKSPLIANRHQLGASSLLAGETEKQKEILKATKSLLLESSFLDQYSSALDNIAACAVDRIGELRANDKELNGQIEELLYFWAVESLGSILLGRRLNALSVPSPAPTAELVHITRHIFTRSYQIRSENTLRPQTPHFQDAVLSYDTHYKLCKQFIEESFRELEQCNVPRIELEFIRKLQLLGKERQTSLAADLLLAGVDGIVHTTIRLLYYLSLNPAKQQKLQDELEFSHAGAEEDERGRYLAACVQEALRLHPVTGATVRRSTAEMELGGYLVPSGVDIILAHQTASVSEKQYGRARSFVPERWTCEPGEPLHSAHAHPGTSCPFGGGDHTCPGRELAKRAVASLTAKLISKYRIEWHGPRSNLAYSPLIHMQKPHHFALANV